MGHLRAEAAFSIIQAVDELAISMVDEDQVQTLMQDARCTPQMDNGSGTHIKRRGGTSALLHHQAQFHNIWVREHNAEETAAAVVDGK